MKKFHLLRVLGMLPLLQLATACGGAVGDEFTESDDDIGTLSTPLVGVMSYGNCTPVEVSKLNAAVAILVGITGNAQVAGPQYPAYEACLSSAAFVENGSWSGQEIANLLRMDAVTGIWCSDLGPNVAAQAAQKPNGYEELQFDRSSLASMSTLGVASVIGHELMHNRGFVHDVNDAGSPLYRNTVPEQVEACIANGVPNTLPAGVPGGREVFGRDGNGAVVHNWQTNTGGAWSGWFSLGGRVDIIESARNADGRLEVFVRGNDTAVHHKWQTKPGGGAWSGWASLGGSVDIIKSARNADGRLEVFARGTDGAVHHNAQTTPGGGAWSGWASLGGKIDLLEVARNADGRLEVFARGSDRAVYRISQKTPGAGTWGAWASLGGDVDLLAVGRNADGRLEVFARGSGRAVYRISQTTPGGAAWGAWASLGGDIDLLAVGRHVDGRLGVLARGTDRAVYHISQTTPGGAWSGWDGLGGKVDLLAAGRNADGRLEAFARGSDSAVHYSQTTPGGAWASNGGVIDILNIAQNTP